VRSGTSKRREIKEGIMIKTFLIGLILAAGLVPALESSADIYSWTDENGVKYFSNQPPNVDPEKVTVKKEHEYSPDSEEPSWTAIEEEWEQVQEQIEEQEERRKAAAESREAWREQLREKHRPESEKRAEIVAQEKERLQAIIAEMEAKPLSHYGSFKNKRLALTVYQLKLQDLERDPAAYFGWED
jgi:hypothetical protein